MAASMHKSGVVTRRRLHRSNGSIPDALARRDAVGMRIRLRRARSVAAQALRRLTLLAEGTALLSSAVNVDHALAGIARLLVVEVADFCAIEAVEHGELLPVATAHRSPEKARVFAEMRRLYPVDPTRPSPLAEVVRTGRPVRWESPEPVEVRAIARDEAHHALLLQLLTRFTVAVPMLVGGRVVGVMKIGSYERSITDEDCAFFEQLASRAALLIENARAYRAEREARVAAEEAVARLARQEGISARLYQDELRSNDRLRLLAQAGELLSRSLDYEVEDRLPLETYLEVVEMKKIVENRANWPLFKEVFNIPEPGEKGLAKNLKWMERINELRRIPAHPARERKYKVDDFLYIDLVHDDLMRRIKEAQANPVLEISLGIEDQDA